MPKEGKRRKVVSLDDYRKPQPKIAVTLEIQLLDDGRIMYDVPDLAPDRAFTALLGCYALAGELLNIIREEVLCQENQ